MFEKYINTIDIQTIVVSLIVLVVSFLRIIPHIQNFSPIIALAIFGALHYKSKSLSYIIPILSLWVSDLLINNFIYSSYSNNFNFFYEGFYWQYISYLVIIFLSLNFNKRKINILNVFFLALCSSLLFFIITNFGFWLTSGIYSNNLYGLIECYIAGIPFYKGTLLGVLFYTPVLIGLYYMLQKKISLLRARHLIY